MIVLDRKSKVSDPSEMVCSVFALGLERVGKTSLLAALTGQVGRSEGYAGSTLYCETYAAGPGW